MIEVFPGIYKSVHEFPFSVFDRYQTSAFFLPRDAGNLLIYSSGKIARHYNFIHEHGGLRRQYLSHVHEAGRSCNRVRKEFNAPVFCPQVERDVITRKCTVDGTFEDGQKIEPDIEVISTPGHTAGSSCFLWRRDDKNILFTGDNLYQDKKGRWSVYLQDKGRRALMIEDLKKLASLKVDIVIPSGCYVQPSIGIIKADAWANDLSACIERLEAGGRR